MKPRPVHLDEVQGRGEEHSKLYEWYSARVPELLTKKWGPQKERTLFGVKFANNTGKILSFSQRRASPVRVSGDNVVPDAGFTIVETMIVLAVTGVLIVSALVLINGQVQKSLFSQSVRELDSKIQDVINDVSTGYYNTFDKTYACVVNTPVGPPNGYPGFANSTGGPNPGQGANTSCINVGRVIQFAVADDPANPNARPNRTGYNIYTMAGRRTTYDSGGLTGTEVQSLYDAEPIPVAPGNTYNYKWDNFVWWSLDLTEKNTIQNGLSVDSVYYTDSSNNKHPVGTVGVFTKFAGYSNGNLLSGSSSADILPIPPRDGLNGLNKSEEDTVDDIAKFLNPDLGTFTPHSSQPPNMNPPGGITVCVADKASNQHAEITIGKHQGNLSTTSSISSGGSCT